MFAFVVCQERNGKSPKDQRSKVNPMAKKSKNMKHKLSVGRMLEKVSLSLIGLVFVVYGSFAVFENKISAEGGFLRGVGWEAEGFPAIGIALCTIYIGTIIIYYTFRK